MHSVKTTFTLPDYIARELSEFAEELGEKKSHMVVEALSQYFDTLDLTLTRKEIEYSSIAYVGVSSDSLLYVRLTGFDTGLAASGGDAKSYRCGPQGFCAKETRGKICR